MTSCVTSMTRFRSDFGTARTERVDNGECAHGFAVRPPAATQFALTPVFVVSVFALFLAMAVTALAGEADVVAAEASGSAGGAWRFDVTVRHADEGWDHYADLWQVLAPDGTVLGERVLAHPHVDEQPFTRSLGNVAIDDDIGVVTIRARDSVHGFGGVEANVDLDALR